jgi:CheY-like chemotaxis protein
MPTFLERSPGNLLGIKAGERIGLRILIVEDEPDTADTMAILLCLWGHRAQIALDGPSALHAALLRPPDVVLLDLGLPGMDGWQVAEQLSDQAGRERPFLIAITGYGQQADHRRSREAGIDLHLLKPVEPDFLQRVLERLQIRLRSNGTKGETSDLAMAAEGHAQCETQCRLFPESFF